MSQTPPRDPWGRPEPSEPEENRGQGQSSAPPGSPPPPPAWTPPSGPPPGGGYPPPSGGYPPPGGYSQPGGYTQQQPFGGGYPPPPPVGDYGPGWRNQGGSVGRAGQLVGWWRRVGATLIDGIILGIVGGVIGSAVGSGGGRILAVLIGAVYSIVLIGGSRAQTVGNMATTSRVVLASNGQPPGHGQSAIRWVVEFVLGITVIGGILDILWPLWDTRNQTLHDKAAGTVVVFTA